MIIAIDGPAGAGKSTIAKLLAKKLGFLYIDTGAMYRALTLKAVKTNTDLNDIDALLELFKHTEIILKQKNDLGVRVFLDGDDVSLAIRTPELTALVYKVASCRQIRDVMVNLQRKYGQSEDIVMEGRDIGTVVFPNADKKFYLDAVADVRAQRRLKDLYEKGIKADKTQVLNKIIERDNLDKNRSCGPLKQADDAVYIDSSNLNIEEVVELLFGIVKEKDV